MNKLSFAGLAVTFFGILLLIASVSGITGNAVKIWNFVLANQTIDITGAIFVILGIVLFELFHD